MKKNKKLLVIAVLLLLISVGYGTYAIYRQSATGTGSIKAAKWSIKVKGADISSANLTFGMSDINWTTHTGKNDTIAPGDSGTITIPVDATGSEVDVLLEAEIPTSASLPDGFTATVTSGTNGKQEIAYNASGMTANVVITVTWTGTLSDTTAKDTSDLGVQGTTLSIPVNLTARQKLSTD